MRRLKLLLPFVVLAGLAVLAWPRAGGRADDELVLVSPHWEGIREEFTWAFEEHWKAKTGRTVRMAWLDLGGTSKCVRYIRSTVPGGTGADIIFGGGTDSYMTLAADGYLDSVDLPAATIAAFPEKLGGYPLRDGQNRWFSACLSTFGISYNRPVLRKLGLPEPREWEDLADPRFFNWVGSGEPRSSGTVHMTYELMLQSQGWGPGWASIVRMAGNVRTFTEGGNGIPRDVAMGQFAAGGAIDFYALEKVIRLGPEAMGFSAPARLPVVNGDPVAVLSGAPHREAAVGFVAFVLSEEGQRLWWARPGTPGGPRRSALGRLPVRPDLYRTAGEDLARLNPFKMEGLDRYDFKRSSRRWRALDDLLGAALIDSHNELRGAWKTLIDAGLPAEGVAEFGAPPCSEEEFLAVADRLWNDKKALDSDRNAQIAEWGRWAREKYGGIRKKYGSRVPTAPIPLRQDTATEGREPAPARLVPDAERLRVLERDLKRFKPGDDMAAVRRGLGLEGLTPRPHENQPPDTARDDYFFEGFELIVEHGPELVGGAPKPDTDVLRRLLMVRDGLSSAQRHEAYAKAWNEYVRARTPPEAPKP